MKPILYTAVIAVLVGAAFITVSSMREPDAVAQTDPVEEGEQTPMQTINLPASDDTLIVEVITGALPNGSELVLETPDGQVFGAVSFFGQISPAEEQFHQIIVPLDRFPAGEVSLVARVAAGGDSRAASALEFRGVRLVDQ